jgi:hypothetical protein
MLVLVTQLWVSLTGEMTTPAPVLCPSGTIGGAALNLASPDQCASCSPGDYCVDGTRTGELLLLPSSVYCPGGLFTICSPGFSCPANSTDPRICPESYSCLQGTTIPRMLSWDIVVLPCWDKVSSPVLLATKLSTRATSLSSFSLPMPLLVKLASLAWRRWSESNRCHSRQRIHLSQRIILCSRHLRGEALSSWILPARFR